MNILYSIIGKKTITRKSIIQVQGDTSVKYQGVFAVINNNNNNKQCNIATVETCYKNVIGLWAKLDKWENAINNEQL